MALLREITTATLISSGKRAGGKACEPSAVEAIGHTPLVELSSLTRDLDGRILAKLDNLYS